MFLSLEKNHSDSKILLGGAITFHIPEFIMEKTGVDVVVEGEAESCILPLVEAILSNAEFWTIPGTYTVINHEIRKPKQKQDIVSDLDALPLPAWDLIDIEEYVTNLLHVCRSENMRSFQISASRGCPYSCNYCNKTLGSQMRKRSKDSLIEEIETAISRYHINDIWFCDEEFALTEKRSIEMCEVMESLSRPLTFVCSMRVDRVPAKILSAMKKAGCRRVIYGVESGSQVVIDSMNKKFTVDQARKAIKETRKCGIEAYVNFMGAYPSETESTFRETIQFMKEHKLYSRFGFTTPLPGTKLFDQAMSNGYIKDLDLYLASLEKGWIMNLPVNMSSIETPKLLDMIRQAQDELFENRIILKS